MLCLYILLNCTSYASTLVDADYLNKKKTDRRYIDVVSNAIDLASWWIKHSVPYGMLKEKQVDVLGKTAALTLPVITRWGSHYTAMKALISNERCMQLLVLEKREKLRNSVGKKATPRATADKMLDLCTDSAFWSGLKTVMRHIGPLLVSVTICEMQHCQSCPVFNVAMLGHLHCDLKCSPLSCIDDLQCH